MTSEVIGDEKQFYSKAKTYWKEVPATGTACSGGVWPHLQHRHQQLPEVPAEVSEGRCGPCALQEESPRSTTQALTSGWAGQPVGVVKKVPHQEPRSRWGLQPEQSSIFADCSIFPEAETVALLPRLQYLGLCGCWLVC